MKSLTRKNKEEYYRKYFEKHDKNSKKIWNGIKEIINIKQKSSSLPSIIIDKAKMLRKLIIISIAISLELLETY